MAWHESIYFSLPLSLSRPGTPRDESPGKGEWGFERWEGTRADVVAWLESEDGHDWASVIGGSRQDAKAARVVVAAALSVWYGNHSFLMGALC